MAASGSTTIQLYNSSTASAVPTSGNLVQGELGINVTDKKIYTKNASAAVVVVGFGPDASVALTALTGLTVSSGGASISGNVSVAGGVSATGAISGSAAGVRLPTASPVYFNAGFTTYIQEVSAGVLQFVVGGTDVTHFSSTGLSVTGNSSATGTIYSSARGTSAGFQLPDWLMYNTSSGNALAFNNGSDRMILDASGNLLVNNEISAKANIMSGSAATSFTGNDQRNFYAQSYSSNTSQYRYMMNHAGSGLWGIGTSTSDQLIIGKASAVDGAPSNILVLVGADGSMLPGTNGGPKIGSTSLRWGELWVTTGAFNTSNAVLKTPIRTMQEKELAAGYQMAQELGTFQWLDSVKEKGDKARRHVGLTVQRAAEIMESHGLDPWSYGFMGYDKWEAVTEIVDATEADEGAYQEHVTRQKTEKHASQRQSVEIVDGKPVLKVETVESDVPITEQIQVVDADGKPVFIDVQEVPAVLDEEGNEATPAIPAHQVPLMHAVPVMETVQVWKRVKEVRPAGESYAFRSDQLAFFIAAGVAAKVGA